MNVIKNAVDMSRFLLFEATADSEADYNDGGDEMPNADDVDDGHDAESCSVDTSCVTTQMMRGDRDGSTKSGFDPATANEEEGGGGGEDEEEEEGEVNSYERWPRKEIVTVDSSSSDKERLKEIERSRLFWESCLAS